MPTYRSINIALHSQFDVETLPEYLPPHQEYYSARGVVRIAPRLIDDTTSTCSVYVPVLPGSTFWIGYSVSPPVPDDHFFLFKLYINNAHIVSWSTGKDEEWKGKTMFGLYERSEDEEGKRKVEKRVLSFTSPDKDGSAWNDVEDPFDERMSMEIRVHRAHGRKRIERELEVYKETQHGSAAKGMDLINAGRASADQPKKFYKFALIDPVDQPFVTFRYFYRTWEQLHYLGVLGGEEQNAADDDMPVIEPCEDEEQSEARGVSRASQQDVFYDCGEEDQQSTSTASLQSIRASGQPRTYIPRGAPRTADEASCDQGDRQTRQCHSGMRTSPKLYRLSVPPSIKLEPPQQGFKSSQSVPEKFDSSSSISYRPHPAYPVENWRERTPSPVRSMREGISTPPLEKNKQHGFRASSLMSALSSWKRRGASSSDDQEGTDSQDKARSISR